MLVCGIAGIGAAATCISRPAFDRCRHRSRLEKLTACPPPACPPAPRPQDVDSSCTILLDGQELQKGQRTRVKPGAVLALGSEAQYQVQRNVFAHA